MILVQRSLCNRSIRNESMRTDLFKPHIAFTNAPALPEMYVRSMSTLCVRPTSTFRGLDQTTACCEARVLNTGWDRRM